MKTPKSNKKNENNSGKKLVQARLPFKVIPITLSDDVPKEINSSPLQLKKRKLSDKDYESIEQKSEEEEEEEKTKECKSKKIKLLAKQCVTVVLSDDEDEDVADKGKKAQTPVIKLPFNNKKGKRRKSAAKAAVEVEVIVSSDETDDTLENDQKRSKLELPVENDQKMVEVKKDNDEKQLKQSKMELPFENEPETVEEIKSYDEKQLKQSKLELSVENELKTVEEIKDIDEKKLSLLDESSDCNTCSSGSSEEKDTTINIEVTSDDKKKTGDNNDENQQVKKPLTKKQLDLMERRRQAREDKERKLNEEKMEKQKEKKEREESKKREREEKEEQRRKERDEKEEKKRLEREEKERKRLAEIEEKRKRTEAKEEERKRKDLEKEEAKLKAKKRAQAFTKFFVAKTETNELPVNVEKEVGVQVSSTQETQQNLAFRPFQIKGAMKLAPICRRQLTQKERNNFDQYLQQNVKKETDNLYLNELKLGKHLPIKQSKDIKEIISETCDDDDVCIVDELGNDGQAILVESNVPVERMRTKFYKFTENRRPPYYGTWRKTSKIITPRKPFAQDTKTFDYELDSDLEWEEEEPGESLEDSEADEKDKECEENDDYDVDNDWLVPHGHLSEEEMENEEEGVPLGDENTREAQKAKLQILQQEFALEMKKKTKKIQPRLVGCIWVDLKGKQPDTCSNIIWQSLNVRAMLCSKPPILQAPPEPEPEEKSQKSTLINESMSHELVRLVHGNGHSKDFLVKEFIAHVEANEPAVKSGECPCPLKSTVRRKIEKYAEWQAVEDDTKKKNKKRLCWVVKPDILIKKGLENLSFDNEWTYNLTPKKQNLKQKQETESTLKNNAEIVEKDVENVDKQNSTKKLLIKNFLKKPTVDEFVTPTSVSPDVITID